MATLDKLISDDLQFVFYDGGVCTKQMDLDAHLSGVFKFKSIEFSEQRVTCLGDAAVSTVRAKMAESEIRYLRV